MSDESLGGLEGLLRQAQELQEQLMSAREEANERLVEGRAGGAVRITVTGGMEFRSVTIDPSAVDPDDVAMLEDLVLAALHDAVSQVTALNRQALGGVASMGGLGDLLGGIGGEGQGAAAGAPIEAPSEPGDEPPGPGS